MVLGRMSKLACHRRRCKPLLVRMTGRLFGRHGLNIETFHLGRRDVGGEALALVETDNALLAGVLDEIKSLPQVVRADSLQYPVQD